MKNLILILILVLSAVAKAQVRYCDLSVSFETPKDGDTVYALTDINYSFWLINNGNDSLFSSDTLSYQISTNFPRDDVRVFRALGRVVAPGDSVLVSDQLWLHKDIEQNSVSIFFNKRAAVFNVTNSKRPLAQEVHPGTLNNVDAVSVVYLKKTASVRPANEMQSIQVYPNPLINDYVMLRGVATEDFKVLVYNSIGEKLNCKSTVTSEGVVRLDLTLLTRGMYYLDIYSGSTFSTHKLLKL